MVAAAVALVGAFWFGSRYPALLGKAAHVGQAVPSMAFSGQLIPVAADASMGWRIVATAINWLDSMRVGMTFGVLFGALLHTVLRYYPLHIGRNLYINSLTGAVVGIPMGVCANCAVPAACGLTRGRGRVEVALGFLFSSPSFNPVVLSMTVLTLPLGMVVAKYTLLLGVILLVVPTLIRWLEPDAPLPIVTSPPAVVAAPAITLRSPECDERFTDVLRELALAFGGHVWALVKPTVTLMLAASVSAAVVLTVVPWDTLLSEVSPIRMAVASLLAVFMPVPIALDVMFAAQLQRQGVAPGYVMLFLTTLGTYSIIPSVYLWREVSRTLSVALFVFFVVAGWFLGLAF